MPFRAFSRRCPTSDGAPIRRKCGARSTGAGRRGSTSSHLHAERAEMGGAEPDEPFAPRGGPRACGGAGRPVFCPSSALHGRRSIQNRRIHLLRTPVLPPVSTRRLARLALACAALLCPLAPGRALAQETGTVSGRVLSPAGEPLEGATVTATPTAGGRARRATSGADGGYRVTGLAPGAWTLRA